MKATDLPNLSKPIKAWSKKAQEKRQAKINAALEKEALIRRCLSKRKYLTRTEAIRVAANQMVRINSPSMLRPYRCKDCGMWHLTKKRLVVHESEELNEQP